jgi:N-acetylmuramoyl-L-alanine amidase
VENFIRSCLLFCIVLSCLPSNGSVRIVIDPGHGGYDRGAGHSDSKESEIVLKISQKLRDLLVKDKLFKVTMTRDRDEHVSLQARTRIAEEAKADLFLSIHVNSLTDQSVRGTEFYIQSHMAPDEEALFLAHRENATLTREESEELKSSEPTSPAKSKRRSDVDVIFEDFRRSRSLQKSYKWAQLMSHKWTAQFDKMPVKVKQGPFYVLQTVSMPSILLEIGYISNAKDRQWMLSSQNQNEMVETLHKAIKEFVDKPISSRHITMHEK